jgi:CRISPR system Cascade subunit CasC
LDRNGEPLYSSKIALEFEVMTYVVVHRIFSLSVSLPVRGADGLAKRALYGGIERQRLSSQSVKSHLRDTTGVPGSMADLATALGTEMSVRSAIIGPERIAPALLKRGLADDEANEWADAVMRLFQSGKKAPSSEAVATKKSKKAKAGAEDEEIKENEPDDTVATSEPGRQILTLGEQEIAALTEVAVVLHKEKIASSEMRSLLEKATKRKSLSKKVQDTLAALDAVRKHAGLDGALFGRMATGIAVSRIDSAVHVGHALTTHAIQSSIDFFSAQDQLLDRDAGETGGAHIGSRELTSGVFYLPVVIDIEQIRKNCAGWTNDEIANVVGWLVKSIATITPAAMLGSTAPFTDPGEVVVEITTGQPVNAMGAFERPVAPTVEASVAAFNHHIERIWSMIGHPAKVARLSEFIDPKASTPAVQRLADAVANAIRTAVSAPR